MALGLATCAASPWSLSSPLFAGAMSCTAGCLAKPESRKLAARQQRSTWLSQRHLRWMRVNRPASTPRRISSGAPMAPARVSAMSTPGQALRDARAPLISQESLAHRLPSLCANCWPETPTAIGREWAAPPRICAPPIGTSAAMATMSPEIRPPAIAKAVSLLVSCASSWSPRARRRWGSVHLTRAKRMTSMAAAAWANQNRRLAPLCPAAWASPIAWQRGVFGIAATRTTACEKPGL